MAGSNSLSYGQNVPPLFSRDTLTIRFFGDLMMHSSQIENAGKGSTEYDFSSYFSLMEDEISEADISVINMEFTLAGEPFTGYPSFSAPDEIAEYAAQCGFDILLAANNHIYDKGSRGAQRTIEVYRQLEDKYDLRFTGIAESEEARRQDTPLFIRQKGIRIAFTNFTYGTNVGIDTHYPKVNYMSDTSFLEDALRHAEENADISIALPHWGEEYHLSHSARQEETAEWLAASGADIIIGTHPHVPQDADFCSIGIPVAYSLGNAVSNMSAQDTQLELMATLKIVRNENGDINMMPLEFTYLWCSRPGGFCDDSYIVIPVSEYIGRKEEWSGKWDYDKMFTTYERVRKIIGIEDK